MQKLLLELGGPLVFAFVLLAIAKFVRGLITRYKHPGETENAEDEVVDETEDDPRAT
jgi:hypothetical protein